MFRFGKQQQSSVKEESHIDSVSSSTYLISEEQLQQALIRQKTNKKSLVEILVEMNLLSQQDLATIANLKVYAIPSIRLSNDLFIKEVLNLVPKYFCLEQKLIPIRYTNNVLTVVIADPMNVNAVERLRDMVRGEVKIVHAEENEIVEFIDQLYPEQGEDNSTEEVLLTVKEIKDVMEEEEQDESVKADAGPVVRLVDTTLRQAIERGASDVHWEPYPKESVVRFRVDGHLIDHLRLPKHIHTSVISRIKILAGMDIAENRRPQDGRCQVSSAGKKVDLRISTVRTLHGEKVVMRLLNKSANVPELEQSGLTQYNYDLLLDVIRRPQGMLLVTGPTGSGKTTTLYSILTKIMTVEKNIITVEDPIEYQLMRVNQIPVHIKAGVTFATILRTVLRQDPDIIMLGEIRDLETSEIAIQAALTGHLVLSTLHTNDAPGALTRLLDLGVKPFLVAHAVTGIVAQRLVRKICGDCREEYEPTTEEKILAARMQINLPEKLHRGKGCAHCAGIGYKGRIAVHEVLKITYRISRQLLGTSNLADIQELALEEGMVPLLEDAMQKVALGTTTFQEAIEIVG